MVRETSRQVLDSFQFRAVVRQAAMWMSSQKHTSPS
jgi:hypothetical protein